MSETDHAKLSDTFFSDDDSSDQIFRYTSDDLRQVGSALKEAGCGGVIPYGDCPIDITLFYLEEPPSAEHSVLQKDIIMPTKSLLLKFLCENVEANSVQFLQLTLRFTGKFVHCDDMVCLRNTNPEISRYCCSLWSETDA